MRFLSLFAGIGGFDLGLERAGMQCVGQVEKDEWKLSVLEKHWPGLKRISDIREVKGNEFGTTNLVCAGVPCQPASSAGKRRGAKDDRWLWPEALRVVFAIKPEWVLFENVYGFVTLESGMAIEQVLSDLENEGYENAPPFIIPVVALDAPHRRDRVWIVSHLNKSVRGAESREQQKEWTEEFCQRIKTDADNNKMRCEPWSRNTGKEEIEESNWNNFKRCDWWEAEPDVGRMVRRFSSKLDAMRIQALGESANPQVVEVIGRAIMETERAASMPQEVGQKESVEGVQIQTNNTQRAAT